MKAMSIDSLRQQIYRTPFHPVTLRLPSGREIVVDNPELAMFNETGRTLIVAQGEKIILIEVATVETMETMAD